jgi:hypothetical protein
MRIVHLGIVALLLAACGQTASNHTPSVGDVVPDNALTITDSAPMLQPQAVTTANWTSGSLGSNSVVALSSLQNLGGGLNGNAIWKSNNPEVIKGNGWLMQNARSDATRGGSATPLSGTKAVYLFHINKSGSTRYVHLLVTNPQNSSLTISGKGSVYTNTERPLNGAGTGPSYAVSSDWLANTPRTTFSNVGIASKGAYQVYRATLNNGALVDGRFEFTASAGVYVYTVVTSSGTLTDAINGSQGAAAAGDIFSPAQDKYGREAGVYRHSGWSGSTDIDVPAAPAYVGLALNTSAKNPNLGIALQEQTSDAIMRLSDSAERTYGNYGHKYQITLALRNNSSVARTVRLSFASSVTGTVDTPSFTYNGAVLLNGTTKTVFVKPTAPRQVLATWTIPANSPFNANLTFYVPGLITIRSQLVLESL